MRANRPVLCLCVIFSLYVIPVFGDWGANTDPETLTNGVPVGIFGESNKPSGEPDAQGAMTVYYPFQLPAARGRPQPRLTLQYNSRTADAEAGYGWGLNLPVIERRPMSGPPRFDHTPGDYRFFYNGQALVHVCQLGATNCPKVSDSAPPPNTTSWGPGPWEYFRLQIDSLFARFYFDGDNNLPGHWKVQLPGGELLEFGDVYAGESATERDPSGHGLRWFMARETDATHKLNYVRYRYQTIGVRSLVYLTDIFDTPRPTGNATDISFAHHTQLTWTAPNFPQSAYAFPDHARPDLILRRVGVASKTWTAIGEREVLRTYYLDYADIRGLIGYKPPSQSQVGSPYTAPLWGHAFLHGIRMYGDCHQLEHQGAIPDSQCKPFPPTNFEYEGGTLGFPGGQIYPSKFQGAPAAVASAGRYIQNPLSAVVVDFNRDGLPDIVQGWESGPVCLNQTNSHTIITNDPGYTTSNTDQALRDFIFCVTPDGHETELWSARPLMGYVNRSHAADAALTLFSHCMDAGPRNDVPLLHAGQPPPTAGGAPQTAPLDFINPGDEPNFFTPQAGVSLFGSWSFGQVAYSVAGYAPMAANPLSVSPGMPANGTAPGSGCDLQNFDLSKFHPGWQWKTLGPTDWAKPISFTGGQQANWFVDVDGDGLVDMLEVGGNATPGGDLQQANVAYTRRYPAIETDGRPTASVEVAQIPFADDARDINGSVGPANRPNGNARFFYADVNGDGLADLIVADPANPNGAPVVRPGDGRGHFGCVGPKQPSGLGACLPITDQTAGYSILLAGGSPPPWPFDGDTFFADVTGDGLADIIKFTPSTGEIRLWVNIDGVHFGCSSTLFAADPCLMGYLFDPGYGQRPALTAGQTYRITFADMNADGVDDIVVTATWKSPDGSQSESGVFVGSFVQRSVEDPFGRGHGTKPGQLIRVHNGLGATTGVNYATVQDLDLAAQAAGTPWTNHSASAESVVKRIVTQDTPHALGNSLSDPYRFYRESNYSYSDPAYDRWKRALVGFRKVRVRTGSDPAVTETTRWFSPCQNNRFDPASVDEDPMARCWKSSDDDPNVGRTGQVVRVDRYVPGSLGRTADNWLWVRTFVLDGGTAAFKGADDDGRHVYLKNTDIEDTWIYDTASPTTVQTPMTAPDQDAAAGDPIDAASLFQAIQPPPPPLNQDGSRHLHRFAYRGDYGVVYYSENDGADGDRAVITTATTEDPSSVPDAYHVYAFPALRGVACTADLVCQPTYVANWDSLSAFPLLQKTRYTYDGTSGDVTLVEAFVDNTVPLGRRHQAGGDYAATAPGALTNGKWITLAEFTYDDFGLGDVQTIRRGSAVAGASAQPYRLITYDSVFWDLPSSIWDYVDVNNSPKIVHTDFVFDRGFVVPVQQVEFNGAVNKVLLDPFGRPAEIDTPLTDQPDPASTTTSVTFSYTDGSPVSLVHMSRVVGAGITFNTDSIRNGLGEQVFSYTPSDSGPVINGWHESDESGRPTIVARPFLAPVGLTDPVTVATTAPALTIPAGTGSLIATYDNFGRQIYVAEQDGTGAYRQVMRVDFHPLQTRTFDAEQLTAGSPHDGAYSQIDFDGFGRVKVATVNMVNPAGSKSVTTTTYDALGRILAIKRPGYTRSIRYDTLSHMVENTEPNTSDGLGHDWTYAYDAAGRLVGSSDARGCGANYFYDGLDRLTGVDYSPCLATQARYSQADTSTGKGFEERYIYDQYDPDQLSSDATFDDETWTAAGHLVGVYDRGSHTRFNYDQRGRIRRTARQAAKPSGANGIDTQPYALHRYSSRSDFDLADRLSRQTTGVDIDPLTVGGASEATFDYGSSGALFDVNSSYGPLIRAMIYDADGALNHVAYADAAATTANLSYDIRRRLTSYHVSRSASPLWTAPHAGYSVPLASDFTTSTELVNYSYLYDQVGNPREVDDSATASGYGGSSEPVQTRQFAYDDVYRLTHSTASYAASALWSSPYAAEEAAGDNRPVPQQAPPGTPLPGNRMASQSFTYDALGDLTSSQDDLGMPYDRSLGTVTLGSVTSTGGVIGPDQLRRADGIQAWYDEAGNLVQLQVERPGFCPSGGSSRCAQWFAYDWDELGQLAHARRWDFDGNKIPQASPDPNTIPTLPTTKPSWDLTYAYSMGQRVRKTATDGSGAAPLTSLEILDTLRLQRVSYDDTAGDYVETPEVVQAYVGGVGRLYYDTTVPQANASMGGRHISLVIGDHLGSSSIMLDHGSGELVERTTYTAYGAVENDFRPLRWHSQREDYKFSGKEENIEVGTTYFGARYYQPYLGRFMSADPLTIHGLGSDLNPYAYVGGRVMAHIDRFGLCEGGYPIASGTVTYTYDCESSSSGDVRAARGEAMASQAASMQRHSETQSVMPPNASTTAATTHPAPAEGSVGQTIVDFGKAKGLVVVGRSTGRKITESIAIRAATRAALLAGKDIASKEVQASIAKEIAEEVAHGAKSGGIWFWAIDFATSPGGDTGRYVPVYQASASDWTPVPGAYWHANRADAEYDARAYTEATGIETFVDESNAKSMGGLPDPEDPPPPIPAGEPILYLKPGSWGWIYNKETNEPVAWYPWWFLH